MSSDLVKLDHYCDINSETVSKEYEHQSIRYIDISSVGTGTFNEEPRSMLLSEAPSRAKRIVRKNDTIISTVRPNRRSFKFLNNVMPNDVASTGFAVLRPKKNANPHFVYYIISDQKYTDYIVSHATGSAYPAVSPDSIISAPVPLFDYEEQKAIAEVLLSLDDKIELLRRQNETLESLAETLFRHTFIDNAQDDWEEKPLRDVLSVKGGATPSTKKEEFWNGDVFWATPRDLSNNTGVYFFETARKITQAGLGQISSGLLPAGTLLLSSRAPIGYLSFSVNPVAINQGYIAIIDNKGFSSIFIYLWLKFNMKNVKSHANGSIFEEISKAAFKQLLLICPPRDLREKFDEEVLPLFAKMKKNYFQIRHIEDLRNALLPKLMSGKIRVQYDNRGE